jgi:hypothetical protein
VLCITILLVVAFRFESVRRAASRIVGRRTREDTA